MLAGHKGDLHDSISTVDFLDFDKMIVVLILGPIALFLWIFLSTILLFLGSLDSMIPILVHCSEVFVLVAVVPTHGPMNVASDVLMGNDSTNRIARLHRHIVCYYVDPHRDSGRDRYCFVYVSGPRVDHDRGDVGSYSHQAGFCVCPWLSVSLFVAGHLYPKDVRLSSEYLWNRVPVEISSEEDAHHSSSDPGFPPFLWGTLHPTLPSTSWK